MPAPVKVPADLLRRLYDTLEALWDCSCESSADQCERCATLDELFELLP